MKVFMLKGVIFSPAKILAGLFVALFVFAQTFGVYIKPTIVRAEDGTTVSEENSLSSTSQEVVATVDADVSAAGDTGEIFLETNSAEVLGETDEESAGPETEGEPKGVGHLQVKKVLINDDGGTKVASDFTINIYANGATPATFPASEKTTIVTVEPGNYEVSEVPDPEYTTTYSKDCAGTIAEGETWNCIITNDDIPEEETLAPYCGDGVINQDWEMCDGTEGCNSRCQNDNQCVEKAFARVVVENVSNKGLGNATDHIFLGNKDSYIPNGTWFLVHNGTDFVQDPGMKSAPAYDNVPGVAVERDGSGRIGALLYGGFKDEETEGNKEHIDGYIEFSNTTATSQENNVLPHDKMEEPTNTIKTMNPGEDEYWMNDGKSYFWMTVNPVSDSYWTSFNAPTACVEDDGGGQGSGGDGDGDGSGGGGGSHSVSSSGSGRTDNAGEVLGAAVGPETPVVLAAALENTGNGTSSYVLSGIVLAGFLLVTRRKKITV